MGRIKKKTTRRKNTSVKRRNKSVKRSVKRRNKSSKRMNMKRGGLKIYSEEQLGVGGQGIAIKKVYEIETSDTHLPNIAEDVGKKVCFVKKIFDSYLQKRADSEYNLRLQTEVELMLKLDHPNIIKMHSWGWDKDSAGKISHPYIIMDYFNCIDLESMILAKKLVATYPDDGCSKNTLSNSIGRVRADIFGTESKGLRGLVAPTSDEAARAVSLYGGGTQDIEVTHNIKQYIIKEIFNGIQYLHENSVIHCDIKPTNIFLNANLKDNKLEVVIGDLGGAIVVDDINTKPLVHSWTKKGVEWFGSPAYIPKEIDLAPPLLTQDYYAFGVVILQVLLMCNVQGMTSDPINWGTDFYDLYIRTIDSNLAELGEYEPLLRNLLYIPALDEYGRGDYPEILKKRREAFEAIGAIVGASADGKIAL
jgi:serine/threonine protein kinase